MPRKENTYRSIVSSNSFVLLHENNLLSRRNLNGNEQAECQRKRTHLKVFVLLVLIKSGESEVVRRRSLFAAESLIVTVFLGLTGVISRPNALPVFSLEITGS